MRRLGERGVGPVVITPGQKAVFDRLVASSAPVQLHHCRTCLYTSTLTLGGVRYPICSRCGNGVTAAYQQHQGDTPPVAQPAVSTSPLKPDRRGT
jgi:hypothetical protein